jgi:hypothetical protein
MPVTVDGNNTPTGGGVATAPGLSGLSKPSSKYCSKNNK